MPGIVKKLRASLPPSPLLPSPPLDWKPGLDQNIALSLNDFYLLPASNCLDSPLYKVRAKVQADISLTATA